MSTFNCLIKPCTACLMNEMKISAAEEIAARKETHNESNKFTCKRCHEQQQENENKERMEETIQELKKNIEEF